MDTYSVSRKKNIANKNASFRRTKQNGLMFVSNMLLVARKNQGFLKIKKQVDY